MKDETSAPLVYISFLVRMWRAGNIETLELHGNWHSEIEHIQSGRRWKFESLNELLSFIQSQAQNPGGIAETSGK